MAETRTLTDMQAATLQLVKTRPGITVWKMRKITGRSNYETVEALTTLSLPPSKLYEDDKGKLYLGG